MQADICSLRFLKHLRSSVEIPGCRVPPRLLKRRRAASPFNLILPDSDFTFATKCILLEQRNSQVGFSSVTDRDRCLTGSEVGLEPKY